MTNENGEYVMRGLPGGELPLRARALRLPIWKGAVEIRSGETSRMDIALHEGATVEGVVRDAEGNPLPAGRVGPRAQANALSVDSTEIDSISH